MLPCWCLTPLLSHQHTSSAATAQSADQGMGTATSCCPVVLCLRAVNRLLLSCTLLLSTCCTGLAAPAAQLVATTDQVSAGAVVWELSGRDGSECILNSTGSQSGSLCPTRAPSTRAPCRAAATASPPPFAAKSARVVPNGVCQL